MIQFGEFNLDRKQALLFCQNKELPIDPKLFELLVMFINQPNIIISRQAILDHLWSDSLVTDNAINKMIANLRKILGDDPKKPRYIQTIPKRGYRLICEVTSLGASNPVKNTPTSEDKISEEPFSTNGVHHKSYSKVVVAGLLLLCSLFLWQALSGHEKSSNSNLHTMELTRAHGAEESARMHPDNNHLYYLKKNAESINYQLWIKNIHTAKTKQIDIDKASISQIIAVVAGINNETTNVFYLDNRQGTCVVYRAIITQTKRANSTMQWQEAQELFNCNDKQLKDIDYHASRKIIYYTAQPQNFWPNQIYAFDLTTQKHSFVTQDEPVGWGHHNIDISPDGHKLLIMSTNSDYKTQLLALNLVNNELTKGIKFDYPVTEAIWHHDSEQVFYYAAPPAHQIIKSDLNGNNASTFVSVSEYLSPQMSLFSDGKSLLFSTEQKNFSNRWLIAPKQVSGIDNSTVNDISPALFHHSPQYYFISKRSGRRQLYRGHYDTKQAQIVTNFSQSHWLRYIAVSADDQRVLLSAENEVYLVAAGFLNENTPLTTLKKENLILTSEQPIIALDWLTKNGVAITTVKNGIPELKIVDLFDKKVHQLDGQWAYGLTDRQHPEYSYFIEQRSNILYRTSSLKLDGGLISNRYKFSKTQITLPNGFYHVKIDSNTLYYGSGESDGDYLNVVPLNDIDKSSKHLLNDFNSYDVSNGKIMLSDIESLEGDVHRTIY